MIVVAFTDIASGKWTKKWCDAVPRVGDRLALWGEPLLTVTQVIWFPDEAMLKALNLDCEGIQVIVSGEQPSLLPIPKGAIAPGWIACDADGQSWWWQNKPEAYTSEWRFGEAEGELEVIRERLHPWLKWPAEMPWNERIVRVT